jgi:hypothetical protein
MCSSFTLRSFASLILTALAASASAAAPDRLRWQGEIPGIREVSADGVDREVFTLPPTLLRFLEQAPANETLAIADWPVAPGLHLKIEVSRHEVLAPGARLLLITRSGVRPLQPGPRIHFWGSTEGSSSDRVMIALDPATGALRGLSSVGGEMHELLAVGNGAEHVVVAAADRFAADHGVAPDWSCDLGRHGLVVPIEGPASVGQGQSMTAFPAVTHTATIAVDTDTELMANKFNDNEGAALAYISDLFAAMNVMYERDLELRLLQGDTFLRVGSDPYNANSGGAASPAELSEFSSYWNANYDHIDRALAAMLSGKSTNPNSASGIAWLRGLCSDSIGYSFTKVFLVNYLAGDAFVAGHEIGHNFGSPHTHCYSPPIDECYRYESGCYSGPTSCPGGPGTVMSYCHIAGCGNNRMEFHDRVVSNIVNNNINPAIGACIFPIGGSNLIFADGFESGDTGGWSATHEASPQKG